MSKTMTLEVSDNLVIEIDFFLLTKSKTWQATVTRFEKRINISDGDDIVYYCQAKCGPDTRICKGPYIVDDVVSTIQELAFGGEHEPVDFSRSATWDAFYPLVSAQYSAAQMAESRATVRGKKKCLS